MRHNGLNVSTIIFLYLSTSCLKHQTLWSQVASVKRRSIEFVEEDRHLAANVRLGFAVTTP
jgi:hypothetical protein